MTKTKNKLSRFSFLFIICLTVCLSVLFSFSFLENKTKKAIISKAATTETTVSGADQASNSLKGGSLYIGEGSEYYMYGGVFSGQKRKYGGAVYVASGGKFVLDGGIIENNIACYGGAIYVEKGGVCHIKSGLIKNNGAQVSPAIHVEPGATLIIDDMSILQNNRTITYIDESLSGHVLTIKNLRNDNSTKVHRTEKITIKNNDTISFFDTELNQTIEYSASCDNFWYKFGYIYNEATYEELFNGSMDLTQDTVLNFKFVDNSFTIGLDKDANNVTEQNLKISYASEIQIADNRVIVQTGTNSWETYYSTYSDTKDINGRVFNGWNFNGSILGNGSYSAQEISVGGTISATYRTLKSINVEILDANNSAVILRVSEEYLKQITANLNITKNSDNNYYLFNFTAKSIDDVIASLTLDNVESIDVKNSKGSTVKLMPSGGTSFNINDEKEDVVYSIYVKYYIIENGFVFDSTDIYKKTLIGYIGNEENLEIPSSVETINDNVFANKSFIQSVVLPSGLKTVGNTAFYNCSNLKTVIIENDVNVVTLGYNALTYCNSALKIYVPMGLYNDYLNDSGFASYLSKLETYEYESESALSYDYAGTTATFAVNLSSNDAAITGFKGDAQTILSIAQNVIAIDDSNNKSIHKILTIKESAFSNQTTIKTIKIYASLSKIEANAFKGCSNLLNIYLPSLDNWMDVGLTGYYANPAAGAPTKVKDIYFDNIKTTELNINRSVGEATFAGFTTITKVVLNSKVKTIGKTAFWYCSGLKDLTISNGVQTIGGYSFSGCTSLTGDLIIPESVTGIASNAFNNCKSLNGKIQLSSKITKINSKVFYACSGVQEIIIPDSVLTIEADSFTGCSGVKKLSIGSGLSDGITEAMFASCKNIETLTINSNPNTNAFKNRTSLKTLTIGDNVSEVGTDAFTGCTKIITLDIGSGLTDGVDHNMFGGCANLKELSVDSGFKAGAFENHKLDKVTIGKNVKWIRGSALKGYYNDVDDGYGSVHIESLESWCNIEFNSNDIFSTFKDVYFDGATTPTTSITIPQSITELKSFVFENYKGLLSVDLYNDSSSASGSRITEIGSDAFSGCSLKTISIPGSVESIGYCAFYNTTIQTIYLSEGIKSIGDQAFGNCSQLTAIEIPASVTIIDGNPLEGHINSLATIKVSEDNTYYSSRDNSGNEINAIVSKYGVLISGCRTTKLPSDGSVCIIGTRAFYMVFSNDVSYPNEVEIPEVFVIPTSNSTESGVSIINHYAFHGADIQNIIISSSVTTIYSYEEIPDTDPPFINSSSNIYVPWADENSVPDYWFESWCDRDYSSLNSKVIYGFEFSDDGKTIIKYNGNSDYVVIPDFVTAIGDEAFKDCDIIWNLTIPASVKSIGQDAFKGCINLEDISLPDLEDWINVELENEYSNPAYDADYEYIYFESSTIYISDITLSGNGKNISVGQYSFAGFDNLHSVTIDDSVTSIGRGAFKGCYITSVRLPDVTDWINAELEDEYSNPMYSRENEKVYFADETEPTTNLQINPSVKDGINAYTFAGYDTLTDLTIGNNVTSIGLNSFMGCGNVINLSIGFGITTGINRAMFDSCTKIQTLTVNSNLNEDAFKNRTSITSLTVGGKVKTIGKSAFEGCSGLQSITLSEGLNTIKTAAFKSCENLSSIKIPASVTLIEDEVFVRTNCYMDSLQVATGSTSYTSRNLKGEEVNAIIDIKNKELIAGCRLTEIPNDGSVVKIGDFAFYAVYSYSYGEEFGETIPDLLVIPSKITSIGYSAFAYAEFMYVVIPTSVTVLDCSYEGYENCSPFDCSISTIYVPYKDVNSVPDGWEEKWNYYIESNIITSFLNIEYGFVFNEEGTEIIDYVGNAEEITIPDFVSSIGSNAFNGCATITELTIPSNVRNIGNNAFYGCSSLKTIKLPSLNYWLTTTLENEYSNPMYAVENESVYFGGAISTSVTIPTSITTINANAFAGYDSLTSITIGSQVKTIKESAFIGCVNIESVYLPTQVEWSNVELINEYSNPMYEAEGETVYFANNKTTTLSIDYEEIKNYTFAGYDTLTEVTILDEVTSIGTGSFKGCDNIANLYIGSGLSGGISSAMFADSVNIQNLTVNSNLNASAFKNRTNLKTLYIGDLVSSISTSAFSGCLNIEELNVGKGVTAGINKTLFGGCSSLTILTTNSSLTKDAFIGCSSIEKVTIGSSVASIGVNAFSGCSGISQVNLPAVQDWLNVLLLSELSNPMYVTANETVKFNNSLLTTLNLSQINVTEIKDYSFAGCDTLIILVTGDNVTSIGKSAFRNCTNLASATIGNNVTTIKEYAFSGCVSLAELETGNNVTTIGQYAFSGCISLENATIGNSASALVYNVNAVASEAISIGASAFSGCISLENLTLGDYVIVGTNAFSGCENIKILTIGLGLDGGVHKDKFGGCSQITTLITNSNLSSEAFKEITTLSEITMGDSVKTIGSSAFYSCSALTSLIIGNGVTSIGSSAFRYCDKLAELKTGSSVKTIGASAFRDCTGLESVAIESSALTKIDSSAFSNCTEILTIKLPNINDWLKVSFGNISANPLYSSNCETGVYFGGTLTTELSIAPAIDSVINNYAFAGYGTLTKLTIGDNITSIGTSAFSSCAELIDVSIGNEVKTINDTAFNKDSKITSLTIGTNVTSIGNNAFYNCSSLETVKLPSLTNWLNISLVNAASNPMYVSSKEQVFFNGTETTTISVNVSTIKAYAFAGYGKLTQLTIGNAVKTIGTDAFKNCSGVTTLTIGSGLGLITSTMFASCTKIQTLSINSNLDTGVFKNRTTIKTLTINNNVSTIGTEAFSGCSGITKLTIGSGLTGGVDKTMFGGCSKLTTLSTNSNLLADAFNSCTTLKTVEIKDNVTSIGTGAFTGCNAITTVKLPTLATWINVELKDVNSNPMYSSTGESVYFATIRTTAINISSAKVNNYVFAGYDTLNSVTIGSQVTEIGTDAFIGCSGLTAVKLPAVATWVNVSLSNAGANPMMAKTGENVYFGGSSTATTTLEISAATIKQYVFAGFDKLTSVTIGSQVKSIGTSAFIGCVGINNVYLPTVLSWNNVKLNNKYSNPMYASVGENVYFHDGANYQLTTELIINPVEEDEINSYVYAGFDTLTRVTIVESVVEIGSYSFDGCLSLEKVDVFAESIPLAINSNGNALVSDEIWGTFNGCNEKLEIFVFETLINNYKTALGWVEYADILQAMPQDPFTYTYNEEDRVATITGLKEGVSVTAITTRETTYYNKKFYNVTEIGESAFSGNTKIKSVIIGDNVTAIGTNAFKDCSGITQLDVGSGLTNGIDRTMFAGCTNIEYLTVDCNLQNGAFFNLEVKNVTIGKNVKSIGGSVFNKTVGGNTEESSITRTLYIESMDSWYSMRLEDINIFSEFNDVYFEGVLNPTEFTIPENVRSIGPNLFSKYKYLKKVVMHNKIQSIQHYAFYATSLSDVTIPTSVTYIGQSAFANTQIGPVNLHEGLKTLLDGAFASCSKIKTLHIPASVTTLGHPFVSGREYLTSLTVATGNTVYTSRNSAGKEVNAIIEIKTKKLIAAVDVTDISIINEIEIINENAFYHGVDVEDFVIPSNVKQIEYYAFWYTAIKNLTIMDGLEIVERGSFTYMNSLENVTIYATTPPTYQNESSEGIFKQCNNLKNIYVPAGSVSAYKSAYGWSAYASLIKAIPSAASVQSFAVESEENFNNDLSINIENKSNVNCAGLTDAIIANETCAVCTDLLAQEIKTIVPLETINTAIKKDSFVVEVLVTWQAINQFNKKEFLIIQRLFFLSLFFKFFI